MELTSKKFHKTWWKRFGSSFKTRSVYLRCYRRIALQLSLIQDCWINPSQLFKIKPVPPRGNADSKQQYNRQYFFWFPSSSTQQVWQKKREIIIIKTFMIIAQSLSSGCTWPATYTVWGLANMDPHSNMGNQEKKQQTTRMIGYNNSLASRTP